MAILVAGGILTTACSTTTTTQGAPVTRPAVETNLTRDAAQAAMFTHFTEVLRRVPTALSLAQAAPKPNLAVQENGITVPCQDNNTTGTGPLNLQVAFWVQGITTDGETDAYQALVQSFTDAGWSTVPDPAYPEEVTRAYTPDGYALIAQLNSVGGLSLTGSSPCFPAANDTTTAPQPTAIPHPTS
jgi:hypothetical protein